MTDETTQLRDAATALKAEEKELRAALRSGSSQVPLAELKIAVARLANDKAEAVARLDKLRAGGLKPVSLEERERVSREFRKWQKCANARVKIRREMWGMIAGAVEKERVEEVREGLGLEF